MKVTITDALLALDVQLAVSKEETRYYLNGFHVEKAREGIFLVATDGHRMLVIHDHAGSIEGDAPIIRLPLLLLKQMKPASKRSTARLEVGGDIQENYASLFNDTGRVVLRVEDVLIDGAFPDWKNILPRLNHNKPMISAVFDPRYLGDFAALSRSRQLTHAIRLYGNRADSPHLVKIYGRPEVIGVLMPMRDTYDSTPDYPSWMDAAVVADLQVLRTPTAA